MMSIYKITSRLTSYNKHAFSYSYYSLIKNRRSSHNYAPTSDDILQQFITYAKGNNEESAEQLLILPEFKIEDILEGTDGFGNTPIMLCAQRNWSECCQQIINLGCNIDHQNVFGSTALMCSAAQGHLEALKVILQCDRLTINLCSRFGQTALMKAIIAGRLESVNTLLAAGARIDICNKQGKTTIDLAKERGHPTILANLIEYEKAIASSCS